jgi:hypothetical protein
MDPLQLSLFVLASVYVVCNGCLQMGTNSRLDSLREDGKYIGKHLRDILDKLPKHGGEN